jgi:hypothetical protein
VRGASSSIQASFGISRYRAFQGDPGHCHIQSPCVAQNRRFNGFRIDGVSALGVFFDFINNQLMSTDAKMDFLMAYGCNHVRVQLNAIF